MPIKPRNMIDEDDPRVCQIGHPAPPWLVNYADLMTELVCFFVILYALSAALNKNIQNAAEQVKAMMDKGQMQGEVKIDKDGLKISIQEQGQMAFFESGKADLTPEMISLMGKITPVLRKLVDTNEVIVEGYTDDIPIKTAQFNSNWDLSTARATSVVKYLVKDMGFPPEKMAAIGYGEFRPITPNTNMLSRQKNRRVVFFVKNDPNSFKKLKSPPAEKQEGAGVKRPVPDEDIRLQPAAEPADTEQQPPAAQDQWNTGTQEGTN